ncbi:MAG: F0F1 ATP synthase subunit A [Verrucomicrobiota bacterium]
MRHLKILFAAALLLGLPVLGMAAEPAGAEAVQQAVEAAGEHAKDAAHATGEHHGLPPDAPVFEVGPLKITSSGVITIIVAIILIAIAQAATRNVQMVPTGLQNFVEWLVGGLYDFFGEILGKELVKKTFWFFCTIFLFILFTNWFGLIPGVGSVGLGHADASGHFHMDKPFLRGGNADLNMTMAMALTFFFLWTVWSFQALGAGGFFKHIFSGGDNGKGFIAVFMMAIFFFVGVIEVISIAFRPVSLSFRLYGNIFAGENILESMMVLVPWLGWLLPLPFYFLELLVGLVQALVFALLTSVFTALMCTHEEGHGEGHGHGEHKHAH